MKSITVNYWNEVPENYTGHIKFTSGYQAWYKNGKLHREDGPARIWPDGKQDWFKNGNYLRSKETNKTEENMKSIDEVLQEAYNESNTNVVNHSSQTKFWEGYRTAVCELATKLRVQVNLKPSTGRGDEWNLGYNVDFRQNIK